MRTQKVVVERAIFDLHGTLARPRNNWTPDQLFAWLVCHHTSQRLRAQRLAGAVLEVREREFPGRPLGTDEWVVVNRKAVEACGGRLSIGQARDIHVQLVSDERLWMVPGIRRRLVEYFFGKGPGLVCMGSNAPQDAVVRLFDRERLLTGIPPAKIYTPEVVGYAKPDPEFLLEIARREGVPVRRCLFFCNSPRMDWPGAREAGLRTVLICRKRDVPEVGHRLLKVFTLPRVALRWTERYVEVRQAA